MKNYLMILACVLLAVRTVAGASYFVWGGVGNDGNDGSAMTPAKAWATLAHADDVVGPGDVVYVKGTFAGQQSLNNGTKGNGSSWSAPVTYRAYDDNDVNFEGSDSAIRFDRKQYVILDGAYNANRRFRVYHGTSNGHGLISYGSDNVKITGFQINPDGKPRLEGPAIQLRDNSGDPSEYWWIYNNAFHNSTGDCGECVYVGVYQVVRAADHVHIFSNTFTLVESSGEGQVLDIKDAYDVDFSDIVVTSTGLKNDSPGPLSIGGSARIHHNTFNLPSHWPSSMAGVCYVTSLGFPNHDHSLYIYRNTFILGTPELSIAVYINNYPGLKTYVYNNVVKDIPGSAYILNLGAGGSKTLGPIYLYHNTFYNCAANGLRFAWGGSVNTRVVSRNNAFHSWGGSALTDDASVDSSWDGDCFYKPGASADTAAFTWDGANRSFNDLRNTHGQEAHGSFGVALPLNAAARPTARIPAGVAAAADMAAWPEYNLDVDGKTRGSTWDAGAAQFPDAVPAAPTGLRVVAQ